MVVPGNTICPGDILLFVDIDLGEEDLIRASELFGQFCVHRRNRLARPTPVGVDYIESVSAPDAVKYRNVLLARWLQRVCVCTKGVVRGRH